jgi:predicted esterase
MTDFEPVSESIVVEKQLRYYLLGAVDTTEIDEIVFAFHGYGQLAYYFSKKFEVTSQTKRLFVFPEGMHRFYLNGTTGRVGASWMTKELRENDISENNLALNRLYESLKERFSWKKMSVIGFSQGGATASRWLNSSKIECDCYISWASVFPPDLSQTDFSQTIRKKLFVLGTEDQYFKDENFEKAIEFYRNFKFEIVTYSGNHSIEPEVLNTILEK